MLVSDEEDVYADITTVVTREAARVFTSADARNTTDTPNHARYTVQTEKPNDQEAIHRYICTFVTSRFTTVGTGNRQRIKRSREHGIPINDA